MIVHKFGGTSVGNAGAFARVADIVVELAGRAPVDGRTGTVVVVSAMSGVTNRLIAGARAAAEGEMDEFQAVKAELLHRHLETARDLLEGPERLEASGFVEDRLHELERLYRSIAVLGEMTRRGCDAVSAFGEQLSSHLLAAALRTRGLRARAFSATGLVVTDDHFGGAAPLPEPTRERLQEQVRPAVEQGVVPVITGFIGATPAGVTTTLGRGGSDYSAALIGAGLGADEVWIWSDVNGILTADPNIVPEARTLDELSYGEAASLARFGAEVLHPKTIGPIVAAAIPLRLLNTFRPDHPGTRIVPSPCADRRRHPAIVSARGYSRVALGCDDDAWSLRWAAEALRRIGDAGVDVGMFSRSFSERSLTLVVRQSDQAHCLRALGRGHAGGVDVEEKVATVSVVGMADPEDAGLVGRALEAVGRHGIRVIAVTQASAQEAVSFCIPEDRMEDAVRFLHAELGLGGNGHGC